MRIQIRCLFARSMGRVRISGQIADNIPRTQRHSILEITRKLHSPNSVPERGGNFDKMEQRSKNHRMPETSHSSPADSLTYYEKPLFIPNPVPQLYPNLVKNPIPTNKHTVHIPSRIPSLRHNTHQTHTPPPAQNNVSTSRPRSYDRRHQRCRNNAPHPHLPNPPPNNPRWSRTPRSQMDLRLYRFRHRLHRDDCLFQVVRGVQFRVGKGHGAGSLHHCGLSVRFYLHVSGFALLASADDYEGATAVTIIMKMIIYMIISLSSLW